MNTSLDSQTAENRSCCGFKNVLQTDRHTDRWTGRQADRQTDRQTDKSFLYRLTLPSDRPYPFSLQNMSKLSFYPDVYFYQAPKNT